MAPYRGTKRRVSDRSDFDPNDGRRPSPHHPSSTQSGSRHDMGQPPISPTTQRGRGRGRGARGGRGSRSLVNTHHPPTQSQVPVDGANDRDQGASQGHGTNQHAVDGPSTPAGPVNGASGSQGPQSNLSEPAKRPSSQPQTTQAPPSVPVTPPPMTYEYLKDEELASWEVHGKSNLIEHAGKILTRGNVTELCNITHELARAAIDGRLDPAEAGNAVHSIIQLSPEEASVDVAEIFLDTLSTIPGVNINSSRFKTLCLSTEIAAEKMRLVFESDTLTALGLVQSSFSRMFIRKQTNILYKQSNYNLLREETEGYSKLITELFSVGQEPDPTSDTAHETFENMKALIGAFDLDAGRVLDVTLDVCASTLIKNYRFFVKLLRMSDYWPSSRAPDGLSFNDVDVDPLPLWARPDHYDWRLTEEESEHMMVMLQRRDELFWQDAKSAGINAFFSLGRRRVLSEDERLREIETQSSTATDTRSKDLIRWISHTRTMPPSGNTVAAQLLGFKLRFYASTIRNEADILPSSLIYLTAMLIKIGFISLLDIYPHLSPDDDSMESVKQKGIQERTNREQAKRGGAAVNALTRAGALTDDTLPVTSTRLRNLTDRSSTPSESKGDAAKENARTELPQISDAPDQKISLLKSLLCIGALPESLYILGRFSWLLDIVQDLPKHIFRILHHCLSHVYETASEQRGTAHLDSVGQIAAEDQSGIPKGGVRLTNAPTTRTLKWAQLDAKDAGEGIDYKFYWDEWADNIPVCRNVDDVFLLCDSLLNLVGVKIGQDAVLLTKLARIGNYSLDHDSSPANRDRWQDLLKRLLCPALSLTKCNTAVVGEVFSLLKRYPVKTRYNIYTEWFAGPTSRLSDISEAFNLTRYETKDIMKKVNKLDYGPSARKLAKASASAPGIVFDVFLRQLEQYDNLIDVVVECGRHFTELSYDVLSWSILSVLGNDARGRVSDTGFTANKWLVSLSSFTGKILKRYSAMAVQPFIQYILSQLRKNSFIDIRVLRDVIQQMSGVTSLIDLTDAQMMALAGGDILRSQTLRQLQDERMEPARPAKRLIASLINNNTGAALLIAIAQQREMSIFNHEQDDNKILSEVFDEVNTVFRQCLDMIRANTNIDQFDHLVPDVAALISDYGLEISTAFAIQRLSICHAMSDYDARNGNLTKSSRAPSTEKLQSPEIPHADGSNNEESNKTNGTDAAEFAVEDTMEIGALQNGTPALADTTPSTPALPSCHPVLKDLADRIEPLLRSNTCLYISAPFLVTFWQLSLSDLLAPTNIYEDEMKKTLNRKAAIVPDRTDASIAAAKRREAEKKAIDEACDRLMKEMKAKLKHFQVVQARLMREKDQWFRDPNGNWNTLNYSLLQDYFLPRLVLSPLDSYYAQKMLFFLHNKGTKNFRTMLLFDRLFDTQTIASLIYTCSSKEAENLGKFLAEVLKTLNEWHSDRKEYERKALGQHNSNNRSLPGFASKMNGEGQPESFLDFEDYRNLLYKWHRKLSEGLRKCLDQFEYMYVKNAITIVTTIAPHYPVIKPMGQEFLLKLQQVRDREQPAGEGERPKPLARQDLWTSANSAQAPLKRREKQWISQQEFCNAKSKVVPPMAINTKVPEPSKTGSSRQLDAQAPDFMPKASLPTNGVPMSAASVEDGEVKDALMVDATLTEVATSDTRPATDSEAAQTANQATKSTNPAPIDQIETKQPATSAEKAQEQHSRPPMSTTSSREDERILKQRAMESIRRRAGSDANRVPKATDMKDEKTSATVDSNRPLSQGDSQPTSRNLAAEQAPDAPRRERERSSRYTDYEPRSAPSQAESGYAALNSRSELRQSAPNRYGNEYPRSSRNSDLSYGRLNTEQHLPSNPMSRSAMPGSSTGAPLAFEGDRRHGDGLNNMGPPPRRDYTPTSTRHSLESTGPPVHQRPNGSRSVPLDQRVGINPERARLIDENINPTPASNPPGNELVHRPEQARLPPIQPPSPRGPRQGVDHGASIRGQASMSSPDRSGFPQVPPKPTQQGLSAPSESTGVHPSRMAQIQERPPPLQTTHQEPPRRPPTGPGFPQSPASVPSGPRSAAPSSAGSPTNYGPPSGPSSASVGNQYGRAEGSRRQFGRLQETLNQSGQAPRPPPNGMGPRGPPMNTLPAQPPATSRGYANEGPSPPSSRAFDNRTGPPPPHFQAHHTVQMSSVREHDGAPSTRDIRGPLPPRSDVQMPPSDPSYGSYDRSADRGPRREPRSDTREPRDRPQDRPDSREQRFERSDRPDLRDTRSERMDDRNYREPPRTERPNLISRDSGARRVAPRELMPEGPSGGREGRDARLRESDRTRERSPRGDLRRETREPRDYSKEYRDRREEPRAPREDTRNARGDEGRAYAGPPRRETRAGAPPPPRPPRNWQEEPKRDFERFDDEKRAPRGRESGGRPVARR